MILGEYVLRDLFPDLDEDQYQPAGIDLKLDRVFRLEGRGALLEGDDKRLPEYREVETEGGVFELEPNVPYVLELAPELEIPEDTAVLFLPRSTLLRSGVSVHTALGDPGFRGKIRVLAVNHHAAPYRIAHGERVVQAVFLRAEDAGRYEGDYGR
ncbi:dCTP deaminase domain-containing protein [Methanopyrus kandleri]|uniref:Probable deoxyuridine 5'-triphosphate nucleotidohydrolase n=1 Tax=Methanopyrus kandleri (strain AV19 / DSM 6324 / JCM 9639 / NBRC 100938) TaxID=190192 RepID=DUT_METKA|nr:deoxyuridine 5'-triphosphate nucleotidohydrolase [Methanopyrus kandleri]Q8TV34.1 RecName: Full=Probable deoxyuridine 5'-triphosphate nucleotidohydrolase; Short=dUTPase; AltName: Full=dUTP pyrophosphatase [Methanopyrus kandleri AV19]AAM02779.1 Deoxycytidine deaminase [Methanopyrus kandleri AV19]